MNNKNKINKIEINMSTRDYKLQWENNQQKKSMNKIY